MKNALNGKGKELCIIVIKTKNVLIGRSVCVHMQAFFFKHESMSGLPFSGVGGRGDEFLH